MIYWEVNFYFMLILSYDVNSYFSYDGPSDGDVPT